MSKMLNRNWVIGILVMVNAGVDLYIAGRFGLAAVNNWLLIISLGLMSLAAYQILGLVEGYKDEPKEQ